jgi:hypothetical protein
MTKIDFSQIETIDHPKMLDVYLNECWQSAFCFALAAEEPEKAWMEAKLLLTIVGGNDSTIQAVRGAIDIGSSGITFGWGNKTLVSYEFQKAFKLCSDKGKYDKFPMTVNSNRKAVAIVHEDVLNGKLGYVLSFSGNPAEDVRKALGGNKYGLHILEEWRDIVFQELNERKLIKEIPMYFDQKLFINGLHLYRFEMEEETADDLISELIQTGKLRFPNQGTGDKLESVESLGQYMVDFNSDLLAKLGQFMIPTHDPMKDEVLPTLSTYKREAFPVQAHVVSAISKRFKEQKSVLLQGETSTGKSFMMTAIADTVHKMKGRQGYFACVMCPPSLTKKWAKEEILYVLPDAEVHLIESTDQLIHYHSQWVRAGRKAPTKPVFFVISFTTMRGDSSIEPTVFYRFKQTAKQKENEDLAPYRKGFICPDCMQPQNVVESVQVIMNENGEEVEEKKKRLMLADEFGNTRRLHNTSRPANAFCSECGTSLWAKKAPTRYPSFKEWTKHEKTLIHAAKEKNTRLVAHIQQSQAPIPKKVGKPRRVAAVEYIRRKMKRFFDISIIDEIHECKGGLTSQGNAVGSLAAASKKVLAGTGTLFGGKASDVYYLLWRLFPHELVKLGFKYSEGTRFDYEFGIVEKTIYGTEENEGEHSNKQSRGGKSGTRTKVLPGISPFVYSNFLMHNIVNVRLKDVWVTDVELVDIPTIFVEPSEDMKTVYNAMQSHFEDQITKRVDGYKLYIPMIETGISWCDQPYTYPRVTMKNESGDDDVIWNTVHLPEEELQPKEAKLREIVQGEISEGRAMIVYVKDTGSSKAGRDVRPRLKKILEDIGARVAILDTTTTKTNLRSDWLKKKVEQEGYNVIISSLELVKVGLDLLSTPTIIYYQLPWSLFSLNQSRKRSYRIGQTKECRIYYLAYKDTYQEYLATLIAQKNKAAEAINGELSENGLSAMLGGEEDLMSMLIKSIKEGTELKGSAEEWISSTSDRARELLNNIGKSTKKPSVQEQFQSWIQQHIQEKATLNVLNKMLQEATKLIEYGSITGFKVVDGVLEVDLIEAFGLDFVSDGQILAHFVRQINIKTTVQPDPVAYDTQIVEFRFDEGKKRKKSTPADGQLAFELF